MKAVILAGGLGTRISEESTLRPKPMIEVGGHPIIWHIMHIYAAHGVTDFIVCAGYRGYMLKEYFANLALHSSDITVDLQSRQVAYIGESKLDWTVTVVDTGLETQTGGRLKRIRSYLDDNEPFCMTYGDGLSDIDITAEVAFHRRHGLLATLAAVTPPARFGALHLNGDKVDGFAEKPKADQARVNGGFFVLHPSVLDLVKDDGTSWEREPLETLSARGQLAAWRHDGFWQPMDTLREKMLLEDLWASGKAPWKRTSP